MCLLPKDKTGPQRSDTLVSQVLQLAEAVQNFLWVLHQFAFNSANRGQLTASFRFADQPDDWGSITVEHKALLDGGSLWSVTFAEHSLVARASGAPPLAVSDDTTTQGVVSIERVTVAASPAVHRVLVAGFSTLEPTGMFELSLEGLATRAISVDASADDMQNVSFGAEVFHADGTLVQISITYIPKQCCWAAKNVREGKALFTTCHDPRML